MNAEELQMPGANDPIQLVEADHLVSEKYSRICGRPINNEIPKGKRAPVSELICENCR